MQLFDVFGESAASPSFHLKKAKACIDRSDWDGALTHARAAAAEAERTGDEQRMLGSARFLRRLSEWELSARLFAAVGRQRKPSPLPEWDGSSLAGKTLLILERTEHIGAPIRFARLIGIAAERAAKCIVSAEPRLVPLIQRTFPQVDVREAGESDDQAHSEADVVASYETLIQYLANNDADIRRSFCPFRPDEELTRRLRESYRRGGRLIGISWFSTNSKKDMPALADWAEFMRGMDAVFVSLQYGDVAAEVEKLRSASGAEIIFDEGVDSLADLDVYASQVSAMDAVLTISNTGAHMSGSLGVPTVILIDDRDRLGWPVRGDHIPWYPSVRLLRKQHRPWAEAFARAPEILEEACASNHRRN